MYYIDYTIRSHCNRKNHDYLLSGILSMEVLKGSNRDIVVLPTKTGYTNFID